jgi:hypothetical protein
MLSACFAAFFPASTKSSAWFVTCPAISPALPTALATFRPAEAASPTTGIIVIAE